MAGAEAHSRDTAMYCIIPSPTHFFVVTAIETLTMNKCPFCGGVAGDHDDDCPMGDDD